VLIPTIENSGQRIESLPMLGDEDELFFEFPRLIPFHSLPKWLAVPWRKFDQPNYCAFRRSNAERKKVCEHKQHN
jgi:hypothetical protein